MKNNRSLFFLFLAVIFSVSLAFSIALNILCKDLRLINEPLHSTLEALGAMSAIVMTIILLREKQEHNADKYFPLAMGFLGRGILDSFHAASRVDPVYVLLYSAANLVGALWSVMVWLPGIDLSAAGRKWILRLTAAGSALLAVLIIRSPEIFPVMMLNGAFTPTAVLINLIAGILFVAASVFFMLDFYRFNKFESCLFAFLFLLFGLSELEFPFSAIWNYNWWFWHLQRLIAYFIVLYYLFYIFQQNSEELITINESLEQKVEDRIAEVKRLYEDVKTNEEKYRLLFEKESDAIMLCDAETTRILDVNDAFLKLYGYSMDEMTYMKAIDLSAEPEKTLASIRKTVAEGGDYASVRWHRKKDGTAFPIEISTGTFTWKGKRVICAIFRDITERKRTEEELNMREKNLRDITSNLAEGIYVLDANGNILFMNPEAERLLGWSMPELTNKNVHDIVHYRKADGSPLSFEECNVHKVIKTGIPFVSTGEVFVRRDGTIFPISVISSPIIEAGRVVAAVTAFRDITERKRIEGDRERLISELKEAVTTIKTLYGILPICSSCKKIRDDRGYWNQIESYISEHTNADFTHSICPECAKKLYPKYYKGDQAKEEKPE